MIEQKRIQIKTTKEFNKHLRKIIKQGKDLEKLKKIVKTLSSGQALDKKYRNHKLRDNKYFKNCYECHIESDWLLVYQFLDDNLILLLINTGSHSELFWEKGLSSILKSFYLLKNIV